MEIAFNQKISLKKLVKRYKIRLILVFGSRVSKKNHQMSDLDIGILFEKNHLDLNFEKFTGILMNLEEIFPEQKIDLAIINQADPLFLKKILENAKLLYGRKKDFASLKLYSFHQYLDYQKYFNLEEKFCHQFLRQFKPR